jgi:glycerophosphoryl diester phosphodiesterase
MLLNIAHRGARSLAPENTLLAARRGYEVGADLWETDVVVTRDEQLILLHDSQLVRTTNVAECFPKRTQEMVNSFTLEDIRRLDAGSWFVKRDPFGQIAAGRLSLQEQKACCHQQVPTLEEALLLTRDLNWRVNLELKPLSAGMKGFPLVERVLAMINRLALHLDHIVVSSFKHRWLEEIRTRRPAVRVQALLGEDGQNLPQDWATLSFNTYNVEHTLIRADDIHRIKQLGNRVNLYTVNEAVDMRRWIAREVDGIITDFPQRLTALI